MSEGTVEAKRIKVDLEVGDSAGEYWLDFGDEEQRDPGYLEYVISANGIAHVIPLADISSDANEDKIAREVDDLRLVAHLKQQIRGAASAVPLLLVLSKVDLVVPLPHLLGPEAGLFRVVSEEGLETLGVIDALPEGARRSVLTWLRTISLQLSRDFASVSFIFSSAPAISHGRLRVDRYSGDIVDWVLREASRPHRDGRRRRAVPLAGSQR
ncbi:hypothetical protein [Micromonospora citrea]|uniref:hypothetical protein n=1 Tax=Micromonospora citrea TaxID=47855 RepID=UPI003C73F2CB